MAIPHMDLASRVNEESYDSDPIVFLYDVATSMVLS